MKLNLSPNDLKKVTNLFDMLDMNIRNAEYVLSFIDEHATTITKDNLLKQSLPPNIAYELLMRKKLKIPSYENPICHVKKLDPAEYRQNPYYQHIHLDTLKSSSWTIENQPYHPYEGFIYNDVKVDESNNYKEIFHVGFFEDSFSYINVSEEDVTWMSVTPNEIETMKEPIQLVHGNVVTFGLGLGYFAYMASIKPNVDHVTIVEKNPHIINLFNTYILPQFEHKEKISIIQKDAFEFAKTDMQTHSFDYAFVDIWHDVDDGFPLYLKMKKMEALNSQTLFLYWLEPSMIAMIRRYVITLIREHLEGWTTEDYLQATSEEEALFNRLFFVLDNRLIQSYDDIKTLLSPKKLQELALSLSITK